MTAGRFENSKSGDTQGKHRGDGGMQFEKGPVAKYFAEHGIAIWSVCKLLVVSRARIHLFMRGDDRSLGKLKREQLMTILSLTPQQLGRDRARLARIYSERSAVAAGADRGAPFPRKAA